MSGCPGMMQLMFLPWHLLSHPKGQRRVLLFLSGESWHLCAAHPSGHQCGSGRCGLANRCGWEVAKGPVWPSHWSEGLSTHSFKELASWMVLRCFQKSQLWWIFALCSLELVSKQLETWSWCPFGGLPTFNQWGQRSTAQAVKDPGPKQRSSNASSATPKSPEPKTAEPKAVAKADPKVAEPKAEAKAEPKPAPKSPEAQAVEPKAVPKHTEPKAAAPKMEPKAVPKTPEPKTAEPKAEPKAVEPKAEPKLAEPKVEPKAVPKTEPQAQPKAEPKTVPKTSEPKAEPKSKAPDLDSFSKVGRSCQSACRPNANIKILLKFDLRTSSLLALMILMLVLCRLCSCRCGVQTDLNQHFWPCQVQAALLLGGEVRHTCWVSCLHRLFATELETTSYTPSMSWGYTTYFFSTFEHA